METADLVDAATPGPVLVFGSPPPAGRDLDLLVRTGEEAALAEALAREGFEQRGVEWVRFAGCSAEAVDLVPAAAWGLPAAELEALFAEATPVEGYRRIVEPSPHHQLLILARIGYRTKRRARLERAEAAPGAWFEARQRAAAWGLAAELDALALREAPRPRPRLRRPLTISLSGLDGAGKSSQAEALADTLERLGQTAVILWSPVGSPLLDLVGKPAKLLLRLLRFGRLRGLAERSATGSVMSTAPEGSRARTLWAAFVGIASLLEQRRLAAPHLLRGTIVIYDRHALDGIVRLRILYGAGAAPRLARVLFRLAAPSVRLAYFLDIEASTSIARKDDIWPLAELEHHRRVYLEELPRHRVRRLDGEAPREQVCAEIAREVWHVLP